jgi:hypothetical protein
VIRSCRCLPILSITFHSQPSPNSRKPRRPDFGFGFLTPSIVCPSTFFGAVFLISFTFSIPRRGQQPSKGPGCIRKRKCPVTPTPSDSETAAHIGADL